MEVDLSSFSNSWYKPGNILKRFSWYYLNVIFLKSGWFPFSSFKIFLLKLYGAKIGKGVLIKPFVNIKYPWFLKIGNNVWIGEEVWIDNLALVTIDDNVCISQGVLLLTGSHNYKTVTFELLVKPIKIENSVWICAKAIVCSGVVCHKNSIITAGSVITADCEENGIYKGNPGVKIKIRTC